jgi:hypothetical protein
MFEFKAEYEEECNNLIIVNATQSDIDNYKWPENIEAVYFRDCWIDHLKLPEGIEHVTVWKSVRSIYVPSSVQFLYISNNSLHTLEVPQDILVVDASENFLTDFKFRDGNPTKLMKLNLTENKLESLHFIPPSSLCEMNITKNNLTPFTISPEILNYAIKHEDCYIF